MSGQFIIRVNRVFREYRANKAPQVSKVHKGKRVIKVILAIQAHKALLALKALAYTRWASREEKMAHNPKCWYQPIEDLEQARQALRFTLSEDVTAAIPPGDEKVYRIAETLAAQFTPLHAEEREALLASSKDVAPIFRS